MRAKRASKDDAPLKWFNLVRNRSSICPAALAVCLLLAGQATAAPGDWTPDAKAIAAVEAAIRMPADPGSKPRPLSHYARYYAGVTIKGRTMIRGELVVVASHYPAGIHIGRESDLPGISDGGCSIVNLLYDVATKRMAAIFCNGYA